MTKSSRRKFIKRDLLGTLLLASGASFWNATNSIASEIIPSINRKLGADVDWNAIRDDILLKKDRIYMNTAGLGLSPKVVVDRMTDLTLRYETNGIQGKHLDFTTHALLSELLVTQKENIALTRNCTEGINIVANSLNLKKGDEILLTSDEHIGGAAAWLKLQKEIGITVKVVQLDYSGKDNLKRIKKAITRKTCCVCLSHITCTTGMVLPVKEIVAHCKKKEIVSCIDGAQAIGMININLQEIDPDFYVASGHKWLGGPKGSGILYISPQIILETKPTYVGAYSDLEYDLLNTSFTARPDAVREEYGTRNIPMRTALGTGVNYLLGLGMGEVEGRGRELAAYLVSQINSIPKVEILTPEDPNFSASIVTIRIAGIDTPKVTNRLWVDDLIRLRYVYENGHNGIRISLSIYNNHAEVDKLVSIIRALAA